MAKMITTLYLDSGSDEMAVFANRDEVEAGWMDDELIFWLLAAKKHLADLESVGIRSECVKTVSADDCESIYRSAAETAIAGGDLDHMLEKLVTIILD